MKRICLSIAWRASHEDNLASATSELWWLAAVCAAWGACQSIPNSQGLRAKRSADIYTLHCRPGGLNARIRLSLRINISLIIEEIYKMVEDFSTQFSPLYLPMKHLAIISRHPVKIDYHTTRYLYFTCIL